MKAAVWIASFALAVVVFVAIFVSAADGAVLAVAAWFDWPDVVVPSGGHGLVFVPVFAGPYPASYTTFVVVADISGHAWHRRYLVVQGVHLGEYLWHAPHDPDAEHCYCFLAGWVDCSDSVEDCSCLLPVKRAQHRDL